MTPNRKQKIRQVLSHRQKNLAVVLENIDDPHNIGAILRTCDAFGISEVHLLYHTVHVMRQASLDGSGAAPQEVIVEHKLPKMRELRSKSAASAVKWLTITKWDSPTKLMTHLKKKKMKLAVTRLTEKSIEPSMAKLTMPIAIVIGNEHDGVSDVLAKKASVNLKIPMVGFVQSLNVSVAAAILLYEAFRQRQKNKES